MMLIWLLLASITIATPFALYYLLLTIIAVGHKQAKCEKPTAPLHTFAILIPAHNEEVLLPTCLQACAALNYPTAKIQTFVIADNCSDNTAAVAQAYKATCLQRTDTSNIGKGYALRWALDTVLSKSPDAVIVLDADCTIEPHALRAFDQALSNKASVIQTNYVAANATESGTSLVGAFGNFVENELFYAPKSSAGLTVLLRGTGMVFARQVLERCPWRASSIVEDTEYTIKLYRAGFKVQFLPQVRTLSSFPASPNQFAIQRGRWVGGNLRCATVHCLPLIKKALTDRNWLLLDLAFTLFAAIRSLVALQFLATCAACLGVLCIQNTNSCHGLIRSSCITLTLVYIFCLTIAVIRFPKKNQSLSQVYSIITGLPQLYLKVIISLTKPASYQWTRTPREQV